MSDSAATTPKRRGRPRKEAVEGERKSISFRVTPKVYNSLVEAANASGYSISEVIERYLESRVDSIGKKSLEELLYTNDRTRDLINKYCLVLAIYDRYGDWQSDPAVRAGILACIQVVNQALLPFDSGALRDDADLSSPDIARLRGAWDNGVRLGEGLVGNLVPKKVDTQTE